MTWRRVLIVTPILAVALAGCGNSPVFKEESFNPKSPYQYRAPAEVDKVCEAARLALLSQGYTVKEAAVNQLSATKAFQPESDIHAVIEFNVSRGKHALRQCAGKTLQAQETEQFRRGQRTFGWLDLLALGEHHRLTNDGVSRDDFGCGLL